jgi:hypothetical protein
MALICFAIDWAMDFLCLLSDSDGYVVECNWNVSHGAEFDVSCTAKHLKTRAMDLICDILMDMAGKHRMGESLGAATAAAAAGVREAR